MIKKLFIVIILSISAIAAFSQTKVIAPITTNSPLDKYPTHYDSLGYAGYRVMDDSLSMTKIPKERRKNGMLVFTIADSSMYQLDSTKANMWFKLWEGHLERIFTAVEVVDWNGSGPQVFDMTFNMYQLLSVQVNSSFLNVYSDVMVIGNELTLIGNPLLSGNKYKITVTYYYKLQ